MNPGPPLSSGERRPAFGEPFVVQWHIHDGCNLACRHCYRDLKARPALDAADRREVLARIVDFLARLGLPGRLHLAGGEPLACAQLPELMARARSAGLRSRVLSNGTLATAALARDLACAECVGVQVSVEGGRAVHDGIRGPGSFDAALAGLATLRAAGLPVTLAMTLHPGNLTDLEAVAALARALADRVYFSRLVPLGRGAELGGGLDRRAWRGALRRIQRLARTQSVALRDPTFRPLFAAPWHAARAPVVAGCAAGWHCLAIESDGTIFPCRRLPVPLGNILADDPVALFLEHPFLQRLRDRDALEGACGRCAYRWVCGGCRAIPHALGLGPFAGDPACPWTRPAERLRNTAQHGFQELRARLLPATFP